MGGRQTEQPMLGKEAVWPASMIPTAADAAAMGAAAEQAPQSHPDPAVETRKRPRFAVLEVCEPASQGLIHAG